MSGYYKQPVDRDLVFVDLETLGRDENKHAIIEFAGIRTNPDASEILDWLHFYIMPSVFDLGQAQDRAVEVNRFSVEEWKRHGAQAIENTPAFRDTQKLIHEAIWVGWNPDFDDAFMRVAWAKQGLKKPSYSKHNMMTLMWPLLKQRRVANLKQETAAAFFNIKNDNAHRAIDDTRVLMEIYRNLMATYDVLSKQKFVTR